MPSSRLYEMLAEAGAKPSGAFQDFTAAANAGNQVAQQVTNYKRSSRLQQLMNDTKDPLEREVINQAISEGKGLSDLFKIRMENAPVEDIAPEVDANGVPIPGKTVSYGFHSKKSRFHAPLVTNVYRGKEFEHKVSQDEITNLKDELKNIRLQKDKVSVLGTPVNEQEFSRLSARETYVLGQLANKGVRLDAPTAAPAQPKPSAAPQGQPQDPVAWLKANYKMDNPTPADIEWAKGKMTGQR